jgi:hypothetical protein
MIDDDSTLPVPTGTATGEVRVSIVAQLANIPEDQIWLAKQKSAHTRRAGAPIRPEVTKHPDFTHKRTNHELRRLCDRCRARS